MLAGCCHVRIVGLVCAFKLDDSVSLWISSTFRETRRRHEPASAGHCRLKEYAGRMLTRSTPLNEVNMSATFARLGQLQTHAAT
jgi:hypothetical protein